MVEQKQDTAVINFEEETQSSNRSLSWKAADDSGVQKVAPNSSASGNTKSKQERKRRNIIYCTCVTNPVF